MLVFERTHKTAAQGAREIQQRAEREIQQRAETSFVAATDRLFRVMTDLEVLGLGGVTNLDEADTCVIGQLALMQGYDMEVDPSQVGFVAAKYRLPYEIASRVYFGVLYPANVAYFELKLAQRLERIRTKAAKPKRIPVGV
jgi:hypothetical protein